jgi:hypothetical protein
MEPENAARERGKISLYDVIGDECLFCLHFGVTIRWGENSSVDKTTYKVLSHMFSSCMVDCCEQPICHSHLQVYKLIGYVQF